MPVDNTVDESVLTRAPVETPKPSYQPAPDTSSSSRYTQRTASTSALYPSAALSAAFPSLFVLKSLINLLGYHEYQISCSLRVARLLLTIDLYVTYLSM